MTLALRPAPGQRVALLHHHRAHAGARALRMRTGAVPRAHAGLSLHFDTGKRVPMITMRISVTILRPVWPVTSLGPVQVPVSRAVLVTVPPGARTHVIAGPATAVTTAVTPGAGPALRGVTQLADVGRPVPVQGVITGPHHRPGPRTQRPGPRGGGGQGVGGPVAPGHPELGVSGQGGTPCVEPAGSAPGHTNHHLLCFLGHPP